MNESNHKCDCGCGRFTKIMDRTDPRRNLVKGQPYPFVKGHSQKRPVFTGDMPLCRCGCGKPTKLAKWTRDGYTKGQPMPFLQGHYSDRTVPITDHSRITVENRGFATPCWITKSAKDKDGYGRISGGKRSLRGNEIVHRRSYEETFGPIPAGMVVHHLCEQKGCVRGDHLEAVTPTEHERAHSKLTPDMVRAIRASDRTQEELAAEYGVTRSNIGYIKRHVTWNDLDS